MPKHHYKSNFKRRYTASFVSEEEHFSCIPVGVTNTGAFGGVFGGIVVGGGVGGAVIGGVVTA